MKTKHENLIPISVRRTLDDINEVYQHAWANMYNIPPMPVKRALALMNSTYKRDRDKDTSGLTPETPPKIESLLRVYPDEAELYVEPEKKNIWFEGAKHTPHISIEYVGGVGDIATVVYGDDVLKLNLSR
jgi:hypothetical protein